MIVADIGERVGWQLREIGLLRDLRSSGQHQNRANGDGKNCVWLRESIVIMEAASSVYSRRTAAVKVGKKMQGGGRIKGARGN
jgi:hypothetical protein